MLQQLKQQRDQLKIYQKKIGVQLEKDRATAKLALQNGNKQYDFELCQQLMTSEAFYVVAVLVSQFLSPESWIGCSASNLCSADDEYGGY